jgi:hypothetical protein
MLSARLVTGEGKLINVSSTENSDLWWGLRGAGHNFGIVTSMKLKAYPQINGGQHWKAVLGFTPDKISELTEAVDRLDMGFGMSMHFLMACFPPDMNVCIPKLQNHIASS